jgi:prevent-host-death family protein
MAEVGIRELRQNASKLLRRVQAGETLEVTDRGRPVALLTPVPSGSPRELLIASGDIVPAERSLDHVSVPLRVPEPTKPSAVLARLRRDER